MLWKIKQKLCSMYLKCNKHLFPKYTYYIKFISWGVFNKHLHMGTYFI